MGYSGNYTGYSVTGFDVFLWILLTAGSIGFPVIVMTICCIKIHFKNKNYQDDYFYNGQLDFKKKGINGPYVSQNCLDKPEIKNLEVIEPSDFDANANNNYNNNNFNETKNVRFKDDTNDNNNINNRAYIDPREMINENPTSLRDLKDAFNNFSRRPSKRDNKSANLPTLNNNNENVYSITKTYNNQNDDDENYQQQYNDQLIAQEQLKQKQQQQFENLYSQVRVQPNRSNNNMDGYLSNNMYGDDNNNNNQMVNPNDDFNNQQPVYMNTSYDDYNYNGNQQVNNSQRKMNRLI